MPQSFESMQALWLQDCRLSFREDLLLPEASEALIRLRLAGICATDLEMLRGYYPFTGVPGHEFIGEVVAAPPAGQHLIGQRVVGEINVACHTCPTCLAGYPGHCPQRTVLGMSGRNGVFAEYFNLPVKNLHVVPDSLPDEVAVFTEPLAAALEICAQIRVLPTDQVLVIGAGRLGQLVAQVLALTGCKLRVVVRHPRQRELLAQHQIAAITSEEVPQASFDLVVEASGVPAGFHLAQSAVRPRGVIALKSTYADKLQVNLSALVVREITVIGSRCGPFPAALNLLANRQVDPRPLIEGCYPLTHGIGAFEHAARPGALKVLLMPGET